MVYFVIIFLAALQLTLVPHITIGTAMPNLLVISAVYVALFGKNAFFPCLFIGIIEGIISQDFYNAEWLLFAITGLILIWLKDKVYRENLFCQIAVTFLVGNFILSVECFIGGMKVHSLVLASSSAYTAIIAPLLFNLKRLHRFLK